MSDRQLPYPLPGKWNPSGPFRNPGGTNPLPAPANLPSTVWFGGRVPVTWNVVGAGGVEVRATWASPTYDLCPWLRGISPDSENSQLAGATPIWTGMPTRFRFQVSSPAANGLGGLDLRGLRVSYREFGHISQVTQVDAIDARQDVTAQFTSSQASAIVILDPKPIRYYRVGVVFEVLEHFGFPPGDPRPIMAIQGAMY